MTKNDVAILLAKEIEAAVVGICSEVTHAKPDTIRAAPNFYMLRTKILQSLDEWVDVMTTEYTESDRAMEHVPADYAAKIREFKLEAEAAQLCEKIVKSPDHYDKFETQDDWNRYRTTTRYIMVLKAGKIARKLRGE